MKKLLLLIAGCLLLTMCSSRDTKALDQAERLLDSFPDSAYRILSHEEQHLSSYDKSAQMRLLLLKTDAMNKLFMPLDSISYMERVLTYYRNHGSLYDRMNALYLMAAVYRDNHNVPMSLQCLTEADKLADNAHTKDEYDLAFRICAQMAHLYHEQRYPKKEVGVWRKAHDLALAVKDTFSAIWCIERQIYPYYMLSNDDSMLLYIHKAIDEFQKHNYKNDAANVYINLVDYYVRKHKSKEAKSALDTLQRYSQYINKDGTVVPGHEAYYSTIGDYYNSINKSDSALRYFYMLIATKGDIMLKESGFQGLMEAYVNLRQPDSVYKYARLYADANDTANFHNSATEIIRMEALYDYSANQQKAKEFSEVSKRRGITIIAICALSILAAIVSLVVFRKKKAETRRERENAKAHIDNLSDRYEQALEDLKLAQNGFAAFKQQKEEEAKRLKEQLSAFTNNANINGWNDEQMLRNHPAIIQLRYHVSHPKELTGSEWNDTMQAVRKLLPKFYNTITQKDRKLTDREIKVCILTRLSLKPAEIGILLNMSQQSVTNIRASINNKLFGQKGTKGFEKHIESIENADV